MQFPLNLNSVFFKEKIKITKFVWNHKRTQIAKAILRKKEHAGGITLPGFKLYSIATIIKTGGYLGERTDSSAGAEN